MDGTSGVERNALDWRVDLLVVQLAVDEDLAFGDVARQVGDGVGDVCARKLARISSTSTDGRSMPFAGYAYAPSFGIVKIGICVILPLRPSTRPARS